MKKNSVITSGKAGKAVTRFSGMNRNRCLTGFTQPLSTSEKIPRSKKGAAFSLVELLIACTIGIIAFLSVGIIIENTFSSWSKGEKQISLQRDAAYSIIVLGNSIRSGSSSNIINMGKGIQVIKGTGMQQFWLNNTTLMADLGVGPYVLIENVESLTFSSPLAGTINIMLTLNNGGFNVCRNITIGHRTS